jgi:RNA polymerase sigma-70 factor (ECF subfamily)
VVELKARDRGPDHVLLDDELNEVISAALATLSEERRMIFVLKVLEHFSYEEISLMMGHSIPKLKTDVHRAKLEMRRIVGPYLEVRE